MLQILAGFVGSAGFAILFNLRGLRFWMASLGGLLSWLFYVVLGLAISSDPIRYLIVSFIITLYAELLARILKTPTTSFITPSLIPLIPGGSLYYTMAYAFEGAHERFAEQGLYTLRLAATLAVGIILATGLMRIFSRRPRAGKKNNRKEGNKDNAV